MTTPAYDNSHDWTASEVVSASNMNTYIRDNVAHLYGGQSCQVQLKATQSIPQGAWTAVSWCAITGTSAEVWDNGDFYDRSTSLSRLTIPETGLYRIEIDAAFDANTSGSTRGVGVKKNGSSSFYISTVGTADDPTYNGYVSGSRTLSLAATDYLEVIVYHNKASGLDLTTNSVATVTYVGQPT